MNLHRPHIDQDHGPASSTDNLILIFVFYNLIIIIKKALEKRWESSEEVNLFINFYMDLPVR